MAKEVMLRRSIILEALIASLIIWLSGCLVSMLIPKIEKSHLKLKAFETWKLSSSCKWDLLCYFFYLTEFCRSLLEYVNT